MTVRPKQSRDDSGEQSSESTGMPSAVSNGLDPDSSSDVFATRPPSLISAIPGPQSQALAARLEQVESSNVTALEPVPIFWERARGANLWDVDGNRFVDLTAAFGVANVGHAHPDVTRAVATQADSLMHGMGDVHPPRVKVELLERLASLYPRATPDAPTTPSRAVLSSSGSDAVETAIKTALLATGKAGLIAFEGAYHGLSFGALDCTWRDDFRAPFHARLPHATRFARFGDLVDVERVAGESGHDIGAVIVEPVQGRGGERVPPADFLPGLRALCDEKGWLLIVDEIYTGFGRTGSTFACEHSGVVPDLLCIGKGLASGMPISACLGRAEVFDAWPRSLGEALHTQTFLGHPTSCAAAIASLDVSERLGLAHRSRDLGARALSRLREQLEGHPAINDIRGLGLMVGVECVSSEIALSATQRMLEAGYVVLPSGEGGSVVSLTPPLVIGEDALFLALEELVAAIESAHSSREDAAPQEGRAR